MPEAPTATDAVELLWAAYGQLLPAYASTGESAAAVRTFLDLAHRARVTAGRALAAAARSSSPANDRTGDAAGAGARASGDRRPLLVPTATLLAELPLVPHWRLGFSGCVGLLLRRGLGDWSAALESLGVNHPSSTLGAAAAAAIAAPRAPLHLQKRRNSSSGISGGGGGGVKSGGSDSGGAAAPLLPVSRRVVVGFASSWFCNSAVGRLMLGLVQRLDRARFSVAIFHVVPASGRPNSDAGFSPLFNAAADAGAFALDARTLRAPQAAASTRKVPTSEAAAAAAAAAAGEAQADVVAALGRLDVLVFCDVGMDPAGFLLSQQRFAPTQAVFWGHPFTSGSAAADYYLLPQGAAVGQRLLQGGENGADASGGGPEGYAGTFSEQLVRLGTIGAFYERLPEPRGGGNDDNGDGSDVGGGVPWADSFTVRGLTLRELAADGHLTLLGGAPVIRVKHTVSL